jgi:hypothetical protein
MKFQKKLLATSISAVLASSTGSALAAFDSEGTDYSNASQSAHMWTPGMEALDTVNNILCFVDQLKTGEMVNQGVYTALVDEKKCETGSSSDTRDKGPSQQFAIVESTRADDESPQQAKFWIPGMNGPGEAPMLVKAFAKISAEPTEADPLQDFTMTFEMFENADGSGDKIGGGFIQATPSSQLDAGKIGIKFFEQMNADSPAGSMTFTSAANIIKNPNGSDGVAITRSVDWGNGDTPSDKFYGLSWNETNAANRVKIKEGDNATNNSELNGAEHCLAKNQLKTAVWDYGVYAKNDLTLGSTTFTAGEEITLNSGFPIVYGADGEKHGFMGYWGMWTEDDTIPSSGIKRIDYSSTPPTETAIDIAVAPGKLWQNSIKNIDLNQIAGIEFEFSTYSENENSGNEKTDQENIHEDFGQWVNYIIKYVPATGDNPGHFIKTHTFEHGHNGPEKSPIQESTVDLSNETTLWLWSEQLGGSVTIGVTDGIPTDVVVAERTQVTQASDIFNNLDNDVTLNCYNRCPRADIDENDLQGWEGEGSPYLVDKMDTETSHGYTINRTDMTLKLGGANVAFASSVTNEALQRSNYQWGVNSGILIPSGTEITSLEQLHDGSIKTWFEWETGLEQWNQYTMASENGAPIVFDEPLNFTMTYDHSEMGRTGAAQGESYNGQTFLLEYGGEGQLWGFPMIEAGDSHYYPAVGLADGTTITDSNGNNYVVKAWHIEQKMESVNNSECSALHLGDVPGGIPSEINSELTTNTDAIPEGAEELSPSVVNGVIKVELD